MIDYGKALTFFTEDPRWKEKIAIGVGVMLASTLLSFLLIGLAGYLIVFGYTIRLLQNVRDGQPTPLPEWDQWGDDLIRGFKALVVALVWGLPFIVPATFTGVGSAIAQNGSDAAIFIGNMIAVLGGCFTFIYYLFWMLMMPGFFIAYASDEQISSGLQVSKIMSWTRQNLTQVALVAIIIAVAGSVFSLLGTIVGFLLLCIGLAITVPLSILATYLFEGHLLGQLARFFPMDGGASSFTTPDWSAPPADTPTQPPVEQL